MKGNTSKGKGSQPVGLASAYTPSDAATTAHPISKLEDSPSYHVLKESGLLTSAYRKSDFKDLDLLIPNSSMSAASCKRCLCPILSCCFFRYLNVPARHVQPFRNNKGKYMFAGPGIHDIFKIPGSMEVMGKPSPLKGHIINGDHSIVVVNQGFIGLAWDNGQPTLLPPGIHEWHSETLFFDKLIELRDHVIPLGPYTLLTVDEGYAAVTQNNGKQTILQGGHVYLLDHRNWKFEKFISLKIQTDTLNSIHATSADNIIMTVSSTVNWRIVDVETVARLAAETMTSSGVNDNRTKEQLQDITKLRNDVLMQAQASLASFVGSVNYSDSFHMAATIQASAHSSVGMPTGVDAESHLQSNPMFNLSGMKGSVAHANEVTLKYGVEIISINIISADPIDKNLQKALASGAVASAEALQAETAARGQSKATKIVAQVNAEAMTLQAQGEAEALLIKARAEADAEILRAEASEKAAKMLEKSKVAVDLAKMGKAADIVGNKDKFFFGQEPGYMQNILFRSQLGDE
eukprot:TRINITY_DN16978_c1_g2_i1.p1 TRINITY_DN16978_c1_g2~~TRINITY_DN16978_c1_g2_i1.p1  ORF type:complete len:520 (+),score=81.98 TRINITY_DN16978_c1_g2_i1:93-1652(+)